ncbi:hypothetical protein VE00_09342 [Pseudogymnoascus sp. WSF 3629]|nr:hypothetical protein VE00_09342 [Pseudogymnoascus sp. WSF 3629]
MNTISEKQSHEPLLPTTTTTTDLEKQPPPTSSPGDSIPHALRKRITAFRSFIRSTTSLENFYDFLAAGLRTGTLVVQGVCLVGVGVWVLGVCAEVVGLGEQKVTSNAVPVVSLVVMIAVLQMVQMLYCVLDALVKYTKVMEFLLRIEELNMPRWEGLI